MRLKNVFVIFIMLIWINSTAANLLTFFNIKDPTKDTSIWLKSVKLFVDKGKEGLIVFENSRLEVGNTFGQVFLNNLSVEGTKITSLEVNVEKVKVEGKEISLCVKKVIIPLNITLEYQKNFSLFIVWHVKEGLKDSCYQPVFSAYIQQTPMRKELLVSVCEDVNTLFFIRTDTNRVEASFLTKRKPEDVCVACDNNLVFILSEGDRSLQVVSTSPLRNVDIFTLPFVIAPYRMDRMKEGVVVIADRSSGYVVVLDVRTGEILRSKRIGFGVADVATSEDKDLIAVSVPEEQKVYFFNSNLEFLGTIRVPGCPFSLWIDRDFIYVTNTTTGNVEVYNLGTFKHKASVFSGRKPVDILDTGKKVYVANEAENSITVFDKAQYVRLKKIQIDGSPWDITFCRIKNWLYVSLKDKKKIAVIDVVRDKIAGYIDIGCAVSAMCVNPGLGAEQLCW